ncbi:MAG TPA: DUF362 domain-containing protein [Vicinamibacterales bacterium]
MPIHRRTFIKTGAACALGVFTDRATLWADGFRVGSARDTSGYAATRQAIEYAGDWPAARIAGRRVIIKPNLVAALPSSTGATTDPEVTRAVVDLALESGARDVLIVESGARGANFSPCGYDFFASYDPTERVRLVDLGNEPVALAPVPGGGLAYAAIQVPEVVLDRQAVYISVGKMKMHAETLATLSTKNQFGLPAVDRYPSLSRPPGRFAMHERGLPQAIVDINMVRPVSYAVVDAIVGMEGFGPALGSAVPMNLVLAGANSVAVDRVALWAMNVDPAGVRHLVLASRAGLGPADLAAITIAGDAIEQRAFAPPPILSPIIEYPHVFPAVFAPALGQSTTARSWYYDTVVREIDVLELHEDSTAVRVVRTLAPLATRAGGIESFSWDGRDSDGMLVSPGRYAIHVRAYNSRVPAPPADGVGWVYAL